MIPNAITVPLNRLRRRERVLALAWGAARWLAVVAAALAVCCLVDWWVDRRRDTPFALRVALLGAQAAIALVVAFIWVLVPTLRRRSDDELALKAEERRPELGQRLIAAVQLNRPNAQTAGMSPALITALTGEAENHAGGINFPALADHRRLKWALGLVALVAISLASALALAPDLMRTLFARQLLADVAIPRHIRVVDATNPIQPAAEPVEIVLEVEGPGPYRGELRIAPEHGPAERVPIDTDSEVGKVTITLPAPVGDFHFEAWVGDGRLAKPGHVKLIARPAVTSLLSSLVLPKFMGTRSDGLPYEMPQSRGELAGVAGCGARIFAKTQKPVKRAELELLGPVDPLVPAPPPVTRTLPMVPLDDEVLGGAFDLREGETAYRVVVWDENDFRNLDPPRRDVRLVPEEPPLVTLIPEHFRPDSGGGNGSAEEFEVEGVPVPLGAGVRIAYNTSHPYGLGRAFLVYRFVGADAKDASAVEGSARPNDENWKRLPLTESKMTDQTGPFDFRRGCFQNSRPTDQVQFFAAPATDPQRRPDRLEGGGRLDFQTKSLPGLKVGDQIEYFIEVTNRNPDKPYAGRSETRIKRVVTVTELVEWIDGALRQEDRIRRLAERQRGLFDVRPKSEKP